MRKQQLIIVKKYLKFIKSNTSIKQIKKDYNKMSWIERTNFIAKMKKEMEKLDENKKWFRKQ